MRRSIWVRFRNLDVRLEVALRRITDAPSASFFCVLAASMMRPTHATKNRGRTLFNLGAFQKEGIVFKLAGLPIRLVSKRSPTTVAAMNSEINLVPVRFTGVQRPINESFHSSPTEANP